MPSEAYTTRSGSTFRHSLDGPCNFCEVAASLGLLTRGMGVGSLELLASFGRRGAAHAPPSNAGCGC
jgi:hypothetical protein